MNEHALGSKAVTRGRTIGRLRRAGFLAALLAAACDGPEAPARGPEADAGDTIAPPRVIVRVLGINDFHGALEPSTGPDGALYGGAARLAARVKAARTPTSVFVSAGDLIGGSPLASGLFHDEPTIRAMSLAGLDLDAVGNHEFDEGSAELLRMQRGACHPVDGCGGGEPFSGATFPFLAANVREKATGNPLFPPYLIRDFGGLKIAFVGMTTKNTPSATVPGIVDDLTFEDEVDTMNALMPRIRAEGAENVVLVVHEGGVQSGEGATVNSCLSPAGRIFEIAKGLPPEVKVVMTGHAHGVFNCQLDGRVLIESASRGHLLAIVDLTFEAGKLVETKATNEVVRETDPPDPIVAGVVDRFVALSASLGDQEVGSITQDLDRPAMGRTVADAMLYAGAAQGAEVALMNVGGVRASLAFARSGPETVDGKVRYAELFEVQPFQNDLRMISVTGEKLLSLLDANAVENRLYVAGLTFAMSPAAPAGMRVVAADVLVNGVEIDVARTYKIVVNNITDGYPQFAGVPRVALGMDIDALVAWFKTASPIAPTAERAVVK